MAVECEVCGKECKNEHGLKTHKRMAHDDTPEVAEQKASCNKCGSTRLSTMPGKSKRVLNTSGTHEGQPYNRIVWRPKECANCGQVNTVRSYEYVQE